MRQQRWFTVPLGTAVIALTAGLAGGAAAQYLSSRDLATPAVVHAQTLWSSPQRADNAGKPREIIADRFAIVDSNGHVRGEMKIENDNPEIVLYGSHGEVRWIAPPPPPHPVY